MKQFVGALSAPPDRRQFVIEIEPVNRRSSRHFPAPWRADKIVGGYVVRDSNGQALAYIYSRENAADAQQFNELTSDEGERVAMIFAKLPELLGATSE